MSDTAQLSERRPPACSDYSPRRATRFYIPLVIQAISQSFTYPLVATVVSHGVSGVAGFGAFAQGLTIFSFFAALGSGLLTTGMVYGKTRTGYRRFFRLTFLFMAVIASSELLVSLPPLDHIVFDRLLALDPEMRRIARDALLFCIPVNVLFLLRNPYQAILYNARASAAANSATLGRIGATLVLSYLFVHVGFVGHCAGVVALTLPVAGECYISRLLAKPYINDLPLVNSDVAPVREQLLFTIPLSFGGMLLGLSGFMIAAFISRAPDPVRMLPIHYVALGLINPLAFAAIRMQAVVLAFPPIDRAASRTFRFALGAGVFLAGVTLLGQIPAVARVYFGTVQNLNPADIKLASQVMLAACVIPVVQALRGHAEGLAAWRKRPNAILAGQAVYLATLVCSLFFFLNLGVPGYLMGAFSITLAATTTFLTIRMGLAWSEFEDRASSPTPYRSGNERL